jgi:hypothetical protein
MFGCKAGRHLVGRSLDLERAPSWHASPAPHAIRQNQCGHSHNWTGGYNYRLWVNGKEYPSEAAITQVTIEGPDYFAVTLRDITEREQVEVVPNAAQEHLEEIF